MANPDGASGTYTSDNPHSVGILWTSDQTDSGTSTSQHTTITKTNFNILSCGIRTCNPNKRAAADACLRPHGTGIGLACITMMTIIIIIIIIIIIH